MNEPIKLVTTKPDAELAAELKQELFEAAKSWLETCTKVNRAGFKINCQTGPNFLGEHVILNLELIKTY